MTSLITVGDYQVADVNEVLPTSNIAATALYPGQQPVPSTQVIAPATVSGSPYMAGSLVRLWARFATSLNALVDPTTVTLKYKNTTQAGATTTTVTPVKLMAGIYYYDLDTTPLATVAGMNNTYEYEFVGVPQGAAEEIAAGQIAIAPAPL